MRYVCLDTNIFIACTLLTGQQHIPEHLQSLNKILEDHNIKFLLPEIIKSEFEGILEEKKREITKELEDLQKLIGKKNLTSSYDKNELQKNIRKLKNNRKESMEEARNYIEDIFSSSNCIEIPLTAEILTKSYLRQVRNLRPFSKEDYSKNRSLPIDVDCVIIESLKKYLTEQSSNDDILYLCVLDKHFYKEDSPHPNIKKEFPLQLDMFKKLSKLLENLGEQVSEDEMQQLNRVQERMNMSTEAIQKLQDAMRQMTLPQDQLQQLQDAMRQMTLPQDQLQQFQDAMRQMTVPQDQFE